ncbi:UNVERIFIED_CONTAM: hypothetical protein FKN15_048089 [Acipenser sinensis]
MRGERRMRRQQPLQQQKPQRVCLTCLLGEEWCFNCGEPWHISPGTFPIWQEEGTRTEVRRRRRQRGRKTWEEEEWCIQCMQYGHEEHHCPEVLPDTDLEWEEPKHPAPEWEEPERPAPEWEEPERPAPEWEEPERPAPEWEEPERPAPEWEEPERPAPEWEEPERPAPEWEEPERPAPEWEEPEEEVELPSREPEEEKAEVPQQPLHMLLRGAQRRHTRLR